MSQHALIAMIEPLEPAGVDWKTNIAYAVELDEVARHMLLRNDEGDAAARECVQRVAPALLGGRVHDVLRFSGMEVVALDPDALLRSRVVRIARDDLARRRRHAMPRKQLDHAMPVSVADRIRRINDNRAGRLRLL